MSAKSKVKEVLDIAISGKEETINIEVEVDIGDKESTFHFDINVYNNSSSAYDQVYSQNVTFTLSDSDFEYFVEQLTAMQQRNRQMS